MNVATEKAIVFFPGSFQNLGAHRVDADAPRHIDGSACDKPIDRTIGGSRTRATGNWVAVQDTAGQCEGTAVINIGEPFQHQIYLRYDFVVNAFYELHACHFMYRTKMTMPNRAHHCIDFTYLLIHRANAADILDVSVNIAVRSTHGYDFVPT